MAGVAFGALLATGGAAFHMVRSQWHTTAAQPVPLADASLQAHVVDASLAQPPAPAPAKDATSKPVGTPSPKLVLDKPFSGVVKNNSGLQDALMTLAKSCDVNIVIPDHIDPPIAVNLAKVRCDAAIEVLLASHNLWYAYEPDVKLLRVALRKDIEAAQSNHPSAGDKLPPGNPVSFDFRSTAFHDALHVIAGKTGINIVVPEWIGGTVTARVKDVPWGRALETVLASNGLWYVYRADIKLLRIAARRDLEDAQR